MSFLPSYYKMLSSNLQLVWMLADLPISKYGSMAYKRKNVVFNIYIFSNLQNVLLTTVVRPIPTMHVTTFISNTISVFDWVRPVFQNVLLIPEFFGARLSGLTLTHQNNLFVILP